MWLVKEVGHEGGLLCRSEQGLAIAKEVFEARGVEYEVVETNTYTLIDPMEQ